MSRTPHPPHHPGGDPWEAALGRHIAGEPTAELAAPGAEGPPGGGRRVPGWALIVGIAVLVVLAAGAAYAGVLAAQNHDRADRWRDRAAEAQQLLDGRTKALNRQTARLNVASTRLRDARQAITRSEEDVAQLSERQRALAAEKAAVEDRRAELEVRGEALAGVATRLVACRDGLGALVARFGQGTTPSAAEYDTAVSSCTDADAAIDAYNATVSPE